MVGSIKELGRNIGRGLSRAWENVTEGWHDLAARSGDALTRFRRTDAGAEGGAGAQEFPSWSLLAGEVIDEGKALVARIEVPGIEREDLAIEVRDGTLYVSGERRIEREHVGGSYYVQERAYGTFQRAIPLPGFVDSDKAQASLRNGVLTVTLPKIPGAGPKPLKVQ